MTDTLTPEEPTSGKEWAAREFEKVLAAATGAVDVVTEAERLDRELPKRYIDDFTLPGIKAIGRAVVSKAGLVARASRGNASRGYAKVELFDFEEFFESQKSLVAHGWGSFDTVRENVAEYTFKRLDCPLTAEELLAALGVPDKPEQETADANA